MARSSTTFKNGNRAAANTRPWTRALEKHAARNPDKLERLAEKTWDMALDGNMQALAEIANRLDGKPVQPVEMTDTTPRTAQELTSDELRRIAAGGSAGAAAAGSGSDTLN